MVLLVYTYQISAQTTATGNITRFTVEVPSMGSSKNIWVYLPKSYEASQHKYPVLYLQDAQNLFDKSTSFSGEWRVDEILDSLNTDLIVIGIEHGNDRRIEELTPFPHPDHGGGKADLYLEFIVSNLKPVIDNRYRTHTGPEKTYIGGSSLGGLFSYYSLLKHPGVFGKALVFSPSFWFTGEIFEFTSQQNAEILNKVALLMMAGEKESETMVPLMFKMRQQLLDQGMPSCNIYVRSFANGAHNENFWSSILPQAVLWLVD